MKLINIIIAEDHKLLRQLLVSSLKQYNIHAIAEASNGIELIDHLKSKHPDIILLDIEMPELNGYEALKTIKKNKPEQKIIIMTQHDSQILKEHVSKEGANAFINKSTEIEDLAETIKLVHQNKYINSSSSRSKKIINEIKFSGRESEIIPLMCIGKSNKQIADQLKIGNKTVEAHKKSLFRKTETNSAKECVAYLLKTGLNNLR